MGDATPRSAQVTIRGLASDVYAGLRNQLVTAIAAGIGAAAVTISSHLWLQRNQILSLILPVSNAVSLIAAGAALGSVMTYARFRKRITNANIDLLTDLSNYRALTEELPDRILEAHSSGKPLSMIIIDLDNFKKVAVDEAGRYEAGDAVLAEFAARLKELCRGIDRVYRYKIGDEFVILAPDTPANPRGGGFANHLRNKFKGYEVKGPDGFVPITFSAGVADTDATTFPSDTPEKFIARAEAALVIAKRTRNTFEIFGVPSEASGSNTRV
jgi:diguanylate cyclase (GGDEF)-like protein